MSSNTALDVTAPEAGGNFGGSRSRRHLLRLCLIVFVASPVLDAAAWLITHLWMTAQYPSTLNYARLWALSWASGLPVGDSWDPMRFALDWFHQHPDGHIYEQLFFIDRIKFQYPPSSLLPLHALSLLGVAPTDAALNRANWWLVAANALTSGAFAYALARRSPDHARQRWQFAIVGALGALLFYPLLRAFHLGQLQVWINALFALSALAWLSGRKQLAGLLIGAICLLKPQFALFMLWGVLRREWRFLAGWGLVVALGLVASLAVFGLQNHLDYVAVLRSLSRTGEAFFRNQSFNGLLNRFYVPTGNSSVWQPHDFPSFNPIVYTGTLLTSGVLIGAALLVPLRGKGASGLLDFLGAALTFTIASPIAWDHHYGILPVSYIAMMFVLLNRDASRSRSLGLATLAMSFLITGHWMGGSWMLWGALVMLSLIYWANLAPRGVATSAIGGREPVK